MKRIIFTFIAFLPVLLGYSQTTYYWVGGTTPAAGAWNTGTNWNTALNGTGTTRTAATTDILVFDGSNVGGTTPTTGAVTVSLTSQSIGKLILQNGADVALARNGAGGTSTLTIGDDPSGNDLVVFAGCKLRLKGTTGSLLLVLNSDAGASNAPPATTSATALIYGDVYLEEGTATIQNRFTSRFKGAFVFTAGSSLTTFAAYAYYPFGTTGSTTTPVNGGVVFETGSSYFYGGGLSPFGSNSTSFLVDFKQGSKFYFRAAPTTNMFGNRAYSDVVIDNNATVTADGSIARMDSLRIESGSTFITNVSGSTPISGHILNNGTLRVPAADPDRNNKIVMAGSTLQNISGTGTYTLADFIISNQSDVKLLKSVQVDTLTYILGKLDATTNGITGPGVTTVKSPASFNTTGRTVLDSFIVTNVADFTGIETGMSVTGAGIAPNTVVVNTSSANGTITLSTRMTATGATQALTIFNGQGVLPVKFGNVTATLKNGTTKVSWSILTEENIVSYSVERSANGTSFNEIGSVRANKSGAYNFSDVNPFVGVNYYRVKAVGIDGASKYSTVLKVNNAKGGSEFAIYPNPVKGNVLSVQLTNLERGSYTLTLLNEVGQKTFSKMINHDGGSANQTISLPAGTKAGYYTMNIIGNNISLQHNVLVQ
jgi:hypothetical protein